MYECVMDEIRKMLVYNGILEESYNLDESNFDEVVKTFQSKRGIKVDGIVGRNTLWELQVDYANEAQMDLISIDADLVTGSDGSLRLFLREDVASAYKQIVEEVHSRGGIVTTDGGVRPLSISAGSNQSATSHHYWGGAFDLAVDTGLQDPERNPFVLTAELVRGKVAWTVYARVEDGDIHQIDAVMFDGDAATDKIVTVEGEFINFTELCRENGFKPIRSRSSYIRYPGRNYDGAEWWHFQFESALINGFSQFGIELLKIDKYSEKLIASRNRRVWNNRREIFGKNWF